MVKRKIVEIDEEKCNGCGLCIPNCHEGALQMIDGKARLISDLFCDGLGACIGHCPQGAIEIIERESEPYNERKVMGKIVKQGKNTIKAHLEHLKEHNATEYLNEAIDFLNEKGIENPIKETKLKCGCPGSAMKSVKSSTLSQWPVQLSLLPAHAPFFQNSDLLVAADCTAFANPNFQSLLKNKSLCIGCPKLDDVSEYREKLTEIFRINIIKSITVAIMEVPCCYGLYSAVEDAVKTSGKDIPLEKKVIGVNGEII